VRTVTLVQMEQAAGLELVRHEQALPLTRMKQQSVWCATARASNVLPVPGGPYRITPLGQGLTLVPFSVQPGCLFAHGVPVHPYTRRIHLPRCMRLPGLAIRCLFSTSRLCVHSVPVFPCRLAASFPLPSRPFAACSAVHFSMYEIVCGGIFGTKRLKLNKGWTLPWAVRCLAPRTARGA